MRITIRETKNLQDCQRVCPDFIYNRFDLFEPAVDFRTVIISSKKGERVVEYRLSGSTAEPGLWLSDITLEELELLILYIGRTHPEVKEIRINNCPVPCGKYREHNHFRVVFPDTPEEMKARVSPKSWSKMRRRNRRCAEVFGPVSLIEYTDGNIPLDVVETFFEYKLATHGRVYNMTAQEYLERYHVTDCYVVKFGDTIGALHFCCEQRPVVYGENHAYSPDMTDYSLGKFIFAHSMLRLAEKGHTEIYLAGGEYEYKTHYGSIEETLYDCVVTVTPEELAAIEARHSFSKKAKRRLAALLPKRLGDWLYRVKVRLMG